MNVSTSNIMKIDSFLLNGRRFFKDYPTWWDTDSRWNIELLTIIGRIYDLGAFFAIRVNKVSTRLEISEYFVFGEFRLRDIFRRISIDSNLGKRENKVEIDRLKERKGSMVHDLNWRNRIIAFSWINCLSMSSEAIDYDTSLGCSTAWYLFHILRVKTLWPNE